MNDKERDEFLEYANIYRQISVIFQSTKNTLGSEGGSYKGIITQMDPFKIGIGEIPDTYILIPIDLITEYRISSLSQDKQHIIRTNLEATKTCYEVEKLLL